MNQHPMLEAQLLVSSVIDAQQQVFIKRYCSSKA